MDEGKITELLFSINGRLGGIESKLDSLSESILKHEARITTLEHDLHQHMVEGASTANVDGDFKTDLLRLLAKGLVVSACAIASLVGASGIIGKIFGS